MESQYINCSCFINDINNPKYENYNNKVFNKGFYYTLKYSNYKILKCYKIIFNNKNYGNIIAIMLFLSYLINLFIFIFKGISPLKKDLKQIINEEKSKNILENKIYNDNLLCPPIKKNNKLILRADLFGHGQIIDKRLQVNNMNANLESFKTIINDIKSVHNTENNLKIEFSDFELNKLGYIEATKYDQRLIYQIYFDILKREHLIIFIFFNCNDHNLLPVKLSRCFFLFVGFIAFNILLFSDNLVHYLFLNNGKYDFNQQIPQITYSVIITQIIEVFLCYLSLTDKYYYQVKSNWKKYKTNNIKKIIKYIRLKLIFFYIFTFVFFIFYWYIISVFCGVYRNT